ncbi:MAG TPA: DUF177 domain-containing protein [Hyphomicrobium sp.]|nr:DUF177 domain-containing protein [Hyphomicrobium sp.]HRO51151.1 DUF177 domain-containing protein [Hyphomicrobium sp.]
MTALRDWVHPIAEIGPAEVNQARAATEEERAELARELDILSCDSLKANYRLKSLGGGRYAFTGNLDAGVTQACVVSLDPVPARIREEFSISLAPPAALEDVPVVAGDREVSSIPDTAPIEDGRIEAGSLIYEVLSAALDPYPRKAGVEFDWVDPKLKDGDKGPFAALAKLKNET